MRVAMRSQLQRLVKISFVDRRFNANYRNWMSIAATKMMMMMTTTMTTTMLSIVIPVMTDRSLLLPSLIWYNSQVRNKIHSDFTLIVDQHWSVDQARTHNMWQYRPTQSLFSSQFAYIPFISTCFCHVQFHRYFHFMTCRNTS